MTNGDASPATGGNTAPILKLSTSMSNNLFLPTHIDDETDTDFEVPADLAHCRPIHTTIKHPSFRSSLPSSPQSIMDDLDMIVNYGVLYDDSPTKQAKYEYEFFPSALNGIEQAVVDAKTAATAFVSSSKPRRKPLPSKQTGKDDTRTAFQDKVTTVLPQSNHQLRSRRPPAAKQDDGILGLNGTDQDHNYPGKLDNDASISADDAPRFAANENPSLEHLLEIGDIDSLRLEYSSRHANDGETDPRVAKALLFIGIYEMRQGDYDEASRHFKKASRCIDGGKIMEKYVYELCCWYRHFLSVGGIRGIWIIGTTEPG